MVGTPGTCKDPKPLAIVPGVGWGWKMVHQEAGSQGQLAFVYLGLTQSTSWGTSLGEWRHPPPGGAGLPTCCLKHHR